MHGKENPRVLSEKEMQQIRDSVEQGVERVVKPFLKRVERQLHVRSNSRVGGFGDPYCHPRTREVIIGGPDDPYCHPKP